MMVAGLSTDHASIGPDKSLIGNETSALRLLAVFRASRAGPCAGLPLSLYQRKKS